MRRPHSTIAFTPLRDSFGAGTDSPRALLERCLETIAERDGEVQAFVTLNEPAARIAADAASARWRAGRPLSVIDGLPIAIKDNFETVDMPTQMGSPAFSGWRSGRDAACVWALRDAGAIIVGKAVTTEFAAREPGPTRNPLNKNRTPGGSSSGSAAAVAAGMVPVAIGSQVIGSVLRPASFCGIMGFKPTAGALNKGGGLDNYSQNCVGVLATSLADVWAVADAIAERAGGDPGCVPFLGGPALPPLRLPERLAVLDTGGWLVADEPARQAFGEAVEEIASAGVRLVDRRTSPLVEAVEASIAEAVDISWDILGFEFRWPVGPIILRAGDRLSAFQHEQNVRGLSVSREKFANLLARRESMRQLFATLVGSVDGAITLAAPGIAPLGQHFTGNPVFNAPASALGLPALSLPLLEAEGMPLGLQLIGFKGRDRELFSHAAWCLAALEHE